ncbi:Malate dehydrogenase [Orchesella cincta]|uniref:Malate dehydrogenase n=1 Tax=Orchesella cincta TaxID=48709 RepID=A0A1D2NDY4_ORCCI|nr:Malate dehydrogenase [Orchesella cincta]
MMTFWSGRGRYFVRKTTRIALCIYNRLHFSGLILLLTKVQHVAIQSHCGKTTVFNFNRCLCSSSILVLKHLTNRRSCTNERTFSYKVPIGSSITSNLRWFSSSSLGTVIPPGEVKRFITDCMMKVGTPKENAEGLADVLVAADTRGHYSHGLNRLDMYVNDVRTGICDSKALPELVKESAATALVDGKNGLGPVIGNFCMELAIKKARESGVGWVVAGGSNHYGIAGWYSLQASSQNLIGMSFTNTSPFLTPTRSKTPALGTNPMTVAAKGEGTDEFVLDMATTAVAVGKVEVQRRKGEPIPNGWALDKSGNVTENATEAMEAASMMPLGGAEINSGYKGYGLALMTEIFCGIMAGAKYGPNVRKWMSATEPANLGQCFVAVDPSCFAPGFEGRLSDLLNTLRNLEPIDPSKPVLVAGDPETSHVKEVKDKGGIQYHINQVTACSNLAKDLNVTPMKAIA